MKNDIKSNNWRVNKININTLAIMLAVATPVAMIVYIKLTEWLRDYKA